MNKKAIIGGTSALIVGLLMTTSVFATNSNKDYVRHGKGNVEITKKVNIHKDQIINIVCTQTQTNTPVGNQVATTTQVVTGSDEVDETPAVEAAISQTLDQSSDQSQTNCVININSASPAPTATPSATATPTPSPTPSASPTATPTPSATPTASPVSVTSVTLPASAPNTGLGGR